MWSGGGNILELISGAPRIGAILNEALRQIDRWVGNIAADGSNDPRALKVARNKPSDLEDGCWSRDDAPTFFPETQTFGGPGTSFCNDLYPAFPFPRMVAGAPIANDIIKCKLKPINPDDYAVPFTDAQRDRLNAVFPEGVCNWSRRGVGQRDLEGTWITFTGVGRYRAGGRGA